MGIVTAISLGIGAAGLVSGAAGGAKNAAAIKKAAAARQVLADQTANDVIRYGNQQAEMIRAEAIRVRGSQVVQQAASGVVIGDGSAQAMVDETTRLSQADALIALENAKQKADAIRMGAAFDVTAAGNQADAQRLATAGSTLSGASSLLGNYAQNRALKANGPSTYNGNTYADTATANIFASQDRVFQ